MLVEIEGKVYSDEVSDRNEEHVLRQCERESRSVVSDSATPWTIQAMVFSRPE